MKRILFILDSYRVGGTTVSTRNIVGLLEKEGYHPVVWALSDNGLLKGMYNDCKQIKTCFIIHALMLESYKEEKNMFRRFGAMIIRFLKKRSPYIKRLIYSYSVKKCIHGMKFDTIVACAEGATTDFVSYINHSSRVAWVRCDFVNYFTKPVIEAKRRQYSCFNHIVCVAEKTKEGFDEVYPEYADKTIYINNPQDASFLKELALVDDRDVRFKKDKICIVSIGRVQEIKRFSLIPVIARNLKERGVDFYWYIIGDGDSFEMKRIEDEIVRNNMVGCVVMLGAKYNAHYYIKNADLLVSTSRSEACPRVVNEAKVLKTPVVSADYRTIFEFIQDHENGLISPIETIADAIYEILTDKSLFEKITKNITRFEFDNEELMKKIKSIL